MYLHRSNPTSHMEWVRQCKERKKERHTHVQSWHCLSEHFIFLGFLKKSRKASEYGTASGAGPSIELNISL